MPSVRLLAVPLLLAAATARAIDRAPPSEAPGRLASTATMRAARAGHTATALPGGHVLVAGGFTGKAEAAASAELYDAATDRFAALPPMVTPRHSHTATTLPDGRVLFAGGYGDGSTVLASAELYDPRTKTFARTGAMGAARAGHIATLLDDGRVLLAGGVGPGWTFLASAELYDPATGRFTATGPMTVARESHVAARLRDGRVLIIGGHRDRRADIVLYASAELYDPASGTFTRTGDMRVRRHKHDAIRLADGRVLVTGGSDERDDRGVYTSTELFDPARGTFSDGPEMRLGRYKHHGSAVLLPGGTVLLGGGAARAETLDPARGISAIVAGDASMAGQFSAVAPLPGGGALITGGYGGGTGPRPAAWVYRP